MFCGKCGNKIPDGGTFCPLCGNRLGQQTRPTAQATPPTPPPSNKPPKRRLRLGVILPVTAICLVVAMLVGLAAVGRQSRLHGEPGEILEIEEIKDNWEDGETQEDMLAPEDTWKDIDLPEVPKVELLDWDTVEEAPAEDFEYELLEYVQDNKEDDVILIKDYFGSESIVKVPAKIDETPVHYVDRETFWEKSGITHVFLPDGVTLMTGHTMEVMDVSGKELFADCENLRQVRLPATSLPERLFENCTALEAVIFSEEERYSLSIEEGAFRNCTALTYIELGERYETIGSDAFAGCTGLKYIAAPGVTEVGESAFLGCNALETVDIPRLEKLGSRAFQDCACIKNISLPSLISMDHRAFAGCTSLESIIAPNIDEIEDFAFENCKSLNTLQVNRQANVFSGSALNGCSVLNNIEFVGDEDGHASFLKLEKGVLYKVVPDGAILIRVLEANDSDNLKLRKDTFDVGAEAFAQCNVKSVTLPASVQYLSYNAFSECNTLESVSLAPGVCLTYVKEDAFDDCPSLKTVDFSNDVGELEYDFDFDNCPLLENVKYPERS